MTPSIGQALRESATEIGLSPTQIAARVERSTESVRKWMGDDQVPSGDVLLAMMDEFPTFAERLGWARVKAHAA